ncbi:hypothetical protein ACMBCM_08535, partial [Spiroplasma sp. K1]
MGKKWSSISKSTPIGNNFENIYIYKYIYIYITFYRVFFIVTQNNNEPNILLAGTWQHIPNICFCNSKFCPS